MNTDRIKEIQEETALPNSVSVQQALLKVWNEVAQGSVPVADLRKLVEDQRMDTCSADEYCDSCADMRSFLDRVEKLLENKR